LRHGQVTEVARAGDGSRVAGAEVDGELVPADVVVVAGSVRTTDLTPFDPVRFRPLDPVRPRTA
jgi:glycine/D-amino acid oxidase-like deaminating enzyme